VRRAIILAIVAILAAAVSAGELRRAETEITRLLAKARPAVVTVLTPNPKDFDMSGVIVASNGVVLTLRSPLMSEGGLLPETVRLRIEGAKTPVEATVIDQDEGTDTVLLDAPSLRRRGPRLGKAADAAAGEWALLVGNTFGAGRESTPSASLGVISGKVRRDGLLHSLHVSALVNPGSFGAPVLDATGLLLGVVAPRITAAGGQTIVVPIDRIREAYREKRTPGRRVFAGSPVDPSRRNSVAGAFATVVAAAAEAGRSVLVGVRADRAPGEEDPPPVPRGQRRRGPVKPARVGGKLDGWDRCSGTIVGAGGHVVCPLRITGWPNAGRRLVVDLPDGSTFKAEVVGTDERLRIALLAIERKDLPVLEPAARDRVRSGRFAIALGFPHEHPKEGSPQVTVGIVSRVGSLEQLHPALQALQTDAGVAGGNRGGPLVDIDGRLLGVLMDVDDTNPLGYTRRMKGAYEGNAGLGFAIPMPVLEKVLPRLRKGVDYKPGFLGVSTRPVEEGLRVVNVSAKNKAGKPTAAAVVGLEKGDVLVEIDGSPLRTGRDLRRVLAHVMAGDEVALTWLRDGRRMAAKVQLGER